MAISVLPPPLTLEQKAKLKKLDSRLSIIDIASLRYANDKDLIKPYAFDIADACLNGELNFLHGVQSLDWRFICDNPDINPAGGFPAPFIGCDELLGDINCQNDSSSVYCLESEWNGVDEPPPAFKKNDIASKRKRFFHNNYRSSAFDLLRCGYAEGGRCFIDAEPFKQWLIKNGDYPLPDDCLLNKWFESAIRADNYLCANWPKSDADQAEAVGDAGAGSQGGAEPDGTTKPRKRRREVERGENNEGLLFVDELLTYYKIEYLDELAAIKAWGKIISGEFTSNSFKQVADNKKSITLESGEKLSKSDFLEKYRKRFKPE